MVSQRSRYHVTRMMAISCRWLHLLMMFTSKGLSSVDAFSSESKEGMNDRYHLAFTPPRHRQVHGLSRTSIRGAHLQSTDEIEPWLQWIVDYSTHFISPRRIVTFFWFTTTQQPWFYFSAVIQAIFSTRQNSMAQCNITRVCSEVSDGNAYQRSCIAYPEPSSPRKFSSSSWLKVCCTAGTWVLTNSR